MAINCNIQKTKEGYLLLKFKNDSDIDIDKFKVTLPVELKNVVVPGGTITFSNPLGEYLMLLFNKMVLSFYNVSNGGRKIFYNVFLKHHIKANKFHYHIETFVEDIKCDMLESIEIFVPAKSDFELLLYIMTTNGDVKPFELTGVHEVTQRNQTFN